MNSQDELWVELNQQTARIEWSAIQRFFAAGRAIYIDPGLDLVGCACAFARDQHEQVQSWMKNGQIAPVSDAQAREWIEVNAELWAVVIKPLVLVQPLA